MEEFFVVPPQALKDTMRNRLSPPLSHVPTEGSLCCRPITTQPILLAPVLHFPALGNTPAQMGATCSNHAVYVKKGKDVCSEEELDWAATQVSEIQAL